MADAEKALDKIDIASELKTLSPIEKRSLELKEMAESIEITDKPTYLEAKKVKRELVSHRTATKDLRLTFTRKLDNLKDQFIKKQDAVLEPSIAGEDVIKEKIAAWEKAEAERKAEEEKRIEEICMSLTDVLIGLKRKESTLEDVKRARAALKMERGLLEPNDRNKKFIKDTVANINEKLDETEQFIKDRMEQERIAEEQRKEQERLDAERKKLEEEKVAAAATPVNSDVQGGMDALVDQPKAEVPTPATLPKEILEPISEIASDIAKKHVEVVDGEMTAFLKKQGYEVDPHNIQATVDLIRAKGYRVIDEVQNISDGTLTKQKHTYLYVQVIDQLEFTTEAKLILGEE